MATAIASSYIREKKVYSQLNTQIVLDISLSHEIIASGRESLHDCHVVSEMLFLLCGSPRKVIHQRKGGRPHGDEI